MTRMLTCALALIAATSSAHAVDPLFADPFAEPLEATLTIDLEELLRIEPDDDPLDGQLQLDGLEFAVRVGPRGKSRLKHCSFPPLWFNFEKSKLDGTILAGQSKIKVVTHCKESMEPYGYVAAEMLVYRMLNHLTDKSFRVRAIKINYEHPERKRQTHHAFLIEHKKRLADRLGLEDLDVAKVSPDSINEELVALVGLFQYMIGNTDFSFYQGPPDDNCCHNIVTMRQPDGMIAPFAYDFDSTGLVNPPYAEPTPNMRIRRVTQRKYRGLCMHNEATLAVVPLFREKQQAILEMLANFDDTPGLRQRVDKYVRQFFATIETDKKVQSKILRRCRNT